ncbi:Cryptochrome-1 [Camellia lanceoleosa]|uniref:Cryptochrome-1 n=2 Tax=Camellia lanceoleosa TaxID=1840588 RepID=A0ACC0IGJ4_9ERIC|nr:Cryptochrome-1 [Camellia lanceoleosa]KAI8024148.1 Cryptochrome-1 [Camellia lanceoleosa]
MRGLLILLQDLNSQIMGSNSKTSVWFRRDLRIEDNPALAAALSSSSSSSSSALFFFSSITWKGLAGPEISKQLLNLSGIGAARPGGRGWGSYKVTGISASISSKPKE